ncbi:hypothetical protein ACHAXR_007115 [Thalassiosira sp. AJA248-18]
MCQVMPDGGQSSSPPGSKDAEVTTMPTPNSDDDHQSVVSSSPVRKVDPVVRAINTIMYGLVVHFGTLWMIESYSPHVTTSADNSTDNNINVHEESPPTYYPGYLLMVLFLHEYWVYLQHSNVFGNPLLQHLDRQYGIALLKSNKHWSIAGTLSAYWARETLGMFLCLPFLQHSSSSSSNTGSFSQTQYLILYSLIYHTIKSRGVRQDALTRSSSRFGIMRLVIDKFYTHSSAEMIVTVLRMFLQGLDTYIHFCIVRDLVLLSGGADNSWFVSSMHVLFFIWVVHAALNQLFRCSTASVMVQTWHSLTAKGSSSTSAFEKKGGQQLDNLTKVISSDDDDDSTEGESISSNSSEGSLSDNNTGDKHGTSQNEEGDQDFIVRQLLHPKRVTENLKGRQGAASSCVDKAVRLETAIAILASFFMLGLGEVPLKALSTTTSIGGVCSELHGFTTLDRRRIISMTLYAWLLWSLLHGIWAMFLKSRYLQQSMKVMQLRHTSSTVNRQRSVIRMLDLAVMIGIATYDVVPPESKWRMLLICALLTGKAFAQSMQIDYPKLVWKSLMVMEFVLKLAILRMATEVSADSDLVPFVLTIVWTAWVVSNPVSTPCEVKQSCQYNVQSDVADVVFLGHPALLADAWALWLLPYSLKERWRPPFWALPLWPFHYLIGWYVCNYRRKLFGDGASFFCCDDNYYGATRMQNWVMNHFARHFVTHPRQVKENIEAAARHAEQIGVKVLCLGALNKAESINSGGLGVVKALGPNRRLSVIHGNHLTAAAVVETIYQCFGDRKVKFFLTGASSKVGWAVAQALRDRYGYDVLCHSTDRGRRQFFQKHGYASASSLAEGSAYSKYWIVGKYDMDVTRLIPQNATAVVFSVPHPLESRQDVRVIEAGTLHMDLCQLDRPRTFSNKLKEHEIFACHAASVVAAHRLEKCGVSRIDEVGPVDPNEMDSWLVDAKKLGFRVPQYESVLEVDLKSLPCERPPVVVVGGGPSGLAVAAYLSQKKIPHILLEAEKDPHVFGSWGQHFTGLEITTQKKWCCLPGLPMSDKDFPNETVTGEEYQRYLKQYVHRYAMNIRRGIRVQSIEKGTEQTPYVIRYHASDDKEDEVIELTAWAVVVATGKHRIPQKNTNDDIVGKLESCGIHHVHSTEMRDDATWLQATQAAQNGRLCIVGFGNSAADLATLILQNCRADDDISGDIKPAIHVAARTIPPVFPRRAKFLRVDTLGYLMRWLPESVQDSLVKILWRGIPVSRLCDSAFPSHLKRWVKIQGRVPVIDKHGILASGFQSGRLVGHGPIMEVMKGREVRFCDQSIIGGFAHAGTAGTKIDMVILATGYQEECVVDREDRLNGLYKCGFGKSDRFLPLRSISEEAKCIAEDISASYNTYM